jgi:hypothetical protein
MENIINSDTAKADVTRWLDLKKIPASVRKNNVLSIGKLTDAVCDGLISIDDNGFITQTLNFPITDKTGGAVICSSFRYKPRVSFAEMQECMSSGNMNIAIATAIGDAKSSVLYGQMDTTDMNILTAIAVFFYT